MKKNKNSLLIRRLSLNVNLGWEQSERQTLQTVFVDIHLTFPDILPACHSDELADTICYATLITHLRQHIAQQSFHLVEHLSAKIHEGISVFLHDKAAVTIHLHKYPPLEGLEGGIIFSFGEKA